MTSPENYGYPDDNNLKEFEFDSDEATHANTAHDMLSNYNDAIDGNEYIEDLSARYHATLSFGKFRSFIRTAQFEARGQYQDEVFMKGGLYVRQGYCLGLEVLNKVHGSPQADIEHSVAVNNFLDSLHTEVINDPRDFATSLINAGANFYDYGYPDSSAEVPDTYEPIESYYGRMIDMISEDARVDDSARQEFEAGFGIALYALSEIKTKNNRS